MEKKYVIKQNNIYAAGVPEGEIDQTLTWRNNGWRFFSNLRKVTYIQVQEPYGL